MKYKIMIFAISMSLSVISSGAFAMNDSQNDPAIENVNINNAPYSKISESDPNQNKFDMPSSLGDDKLEVPVDNPNLSDNSEQYLAKCNVTLSKIIAMSRGLTLVSSSDVTSTKSDKKISLTYNAKTLPDSDSSEGKIRVTCTINNDQVNIRYKAL